MAFFFCAWFISLSTIISSSIYAVTYDGIFDSLIVFVHTYHIGFIY